MFVQHGRLRASNVIDVGYDKDEIIDAVTFALNDAEFRRDLEDCKNPYGDGTAAKKTVKVLTSLTLSPALLEKWMDSGETFIQRDI